MSPPPTLCSTRAVPSALNVPADSTRTPPFPTSNYAASCTRSLPLSFVKTARQHPQGSSDHAGPEPPGHRPPAQLYRVAEPLLSHTRVRRSAVAFSSRPDVMRLSAGSWRAASCFTRSSSSPISPKSCRGTSSSKSRTPSATCTKRRASFIGKSRVGTSTPRGPPDALNPPAAISSRRTSCSKVSRSSRPRFRGLGPTTRRRRTRASSSRASAAAVSAGSRLPTLACPRSSGTRRR